MTKHSKNNTASSIFTYAEYKKLDYGTKRQRLGNESMRRFDACALCLNRAREPLACHEGHLFCKECVYTDLLSQKQAIKKQKTKLEALKREAEDERTRARNAARERVLQDFEKGQLGLGNSGVGSGLRIDAKETVKSPGGTEEEKTGEKRKQPSSSSSTTPFSFSPSQVAALAAEAEEAALKKIEAEQALAAKDKLPDFWLPSLTPTFTGTSSSSTENGIPQSIEEAEKKMESAKTLCRGGGVGASHTVAMKTLIPVKFTFYMPSSTSGSSTAINTNESNTRKDEGDPICPSCKKRLSNSVMLFLSKPCAHVTCKTCTDTLVRPAMQCIVCDHKLKEKDIIELKREGTGFAGGGLAETSKAGIAFQG
ncbi:hypothetical protein M413DRAFT_445515 [Hebeloma cylindrosporum]|uniref:RING-type domain-containing protein n=1 Tax=Hebeloma cylindrosporum TaxID=76867 RepID=A0A0C2YKH4_HEBCY|nr:hypothetical protein M413DRAFT_445515 [Hebeloma cylindrosporum h7]